MIRNPIHKVLSSMQANRVRVLLMGGQACVFYGAAEFSRDTDFAILADATNLVRLRKALDDLQGKVIAVPPFELKYLKRGHAIHFRCQHPDTLGMRIDIMSKMRGVEPFPKLWQRRTTIELPDGLTCNLLSLPDLVQAKKTQRDKDWPMIRRLLEAHYFENRAALSPSQIRFWLSELRTPAFLIEVATRYPKLANKLVSKRRLIVDAISGEAADLEAALRSEEASERERDRVYWLPLRKELESLRHRRSQKRR